MLFFNKQFENSDFGIQGDYQFRFWDAGSDLEQILLRTGVTYTPKKANILFTAGYGHIISGAYGDSDATSSENRIYQEALIPQKLGTRFYLTHRFRYEQRFVQTQDFRTRYRYNIFINVPLNKPVFEKKSIYCALYNEIFVNGQTNIGEGRKVELFDRNRTYLGLGYALDDYFKVQVGWMNQTVNAYQKGQAQVSLHGTF